MAEVYDDGLLSPAELRARRLSERREMIIRATNRIMYEPTPIPDAAPWLIEKNWRNGAACREGSETIKELDVFYGGENTSGSISKEERSLIGLAAKAVCGRCVVRMACLEYALKNDEAGIWGGMTEDERKELKRRRA